MKIGTLLDRVVFDSITVLEVRKCERNRASEGVILLEEFVSIQALINVSNFHNFLDARAQRAVSLIAVSCLP